MLRFLAKLSTLDARWLYLLLIASIVASAYLRLPLAFKPSPETQGFYNTIEALDGSKPVLLMSDWDQGTVGELRAQFYATVRHLFRKNIRFVLVSGNLNGPRFYLEAMDQLSKQYGKEYGKDWVSFGFKLPDPKPNSVEAISRNFAELVGKDEVGKKATDYAWLKDVRFAEDWALVISIVYSEIREFLTYFVEAGRTPYIAGCAAIVSTYSYPFFSTGTMKGILIGARGGGEYEQMIAREEGRQVGGTFGERLLIGQSAGHFLLLFGIIVGNVGALAKRALERRS
ncbi:MAG: hypothetical protein U0R49_09705 [Fimbriimonadales bacterium]